MAIGALSLRLVVGAVALAGLSWSWHASAALKTVPFEKMAIKVVRGETYAPETFEEALARPAVGCLPRLQRSELLLRAGAVDVSIANGALDRIDADMRALAQASDALLACSPREGFGWFMQFWTGSRNRGLTDAAMDDLARSYRFAPREPWISVRRNPVAMAIYGRLPAPLAGGGAESNFAISSALSSTDRRWKRCCWSRPISASSFGRACAAGRGDAQRLCPRAALQTASTARCRGSTRCRTGPGSGSDDEHRHPTGPTSPPRPQPRPMPAPQPLLPDNKIIHAATTERTILVTLFVLIFLSYGRSVATSSTTTFYMTKDNLVDPIGSYLPHMRLLFLRIDDHHRCLWCRINWALSKIPWLYAPFAIMALDVVSLGDRHQGSRAQCGGDVRALARLGDADVPHRAFYSRSRPVSTSSPGSASQRVRRAGLSQDRHP